MYAFAMSACLCWMSVCSTRSDICSTVGGCSFVYVLLIVSRTEFVIVVRLICWLTAVAAFSIAVVIFVASNDDCLPSRFMTVFIVCVNNILHPLFATMFICRQAV